MTRRWTDETKELLEREWYKGTIIPEIAIMCKRTETAINTKVHLMRLGRRITAGIHGRKNIRGSAGFAGLKKRNCLMCSIKFQTEWKQQWVCNPCRRSSAWTSSDSRV